MKYLNQAKVLILFISLLYSTVVLSHGPTVKEKSDTALFSGLETSAGKAVLAFQTALETGDAKTARSLLADDVLIFEGKGVERSAEEYASHHMISDMRYLHAMTIVSIEHHVKEHGALAISNSRSRVKGTYKNQEINRIGNETIILERLDGDWKITHIHWSN